MRAWQHSISPGTSATLTLIAYVFLAVGGGLLAFGLGAHTNSREALGGWHTTEGQVVRLERFKLTNVTENAPPRPVTRFTAHDGTVVEFTSSHGAWSYRIGQSVRVLYPAASPRSARLGDFKDLWMGVTILYGLGGLFAVVGGSMLAYRGRGRRRISRLIATGRAVDAVITKLEPNTTLTVNGKNPMKLIAEWRDPATFEVRSFERAAVWQDQAQAITVGQRVRVWIDPERVDFYHVDVESN